MAILHGTSNPHKHVHIVAVPYPAQGHTVPLMQLCNQLATLEGYTITFVNTEHIHVRMLQAATTATCDDGWGACGNPSKAPFHDSIKLVSIPGGFPPELHMDPKQAEAAFRASEELAQPFLRLLEGLTNSCGPPVTHIISDVMMSWTQFSADKLHIPRLAFWTSSASVYYVVWSFYEKVSKGTPPSEATNARFFKFNGAGDNDKLMIWIPGLPPMSSQDIPTILPTDPDDFLYQFLVRQLEPLKRAACILMNTFYELEEQVISELLAVAAPPILPIGPLVPRAMLKMAAGSSSTSRISHGLDMACSAADKDGCNSLSLEDFHIGSGSIFGENTECLQWLDMHSPRSVLYISFGSLLRMTSDQFTELAAGVDASGQSFLWAIRPDFVDGGWYTSKLPSSFRESSRGKGLMIGWVPQFQVLAHPAIGGFLTHCGWNSVLESVCLGVPMLCWPDEGERHANGLLATMLWRTGLGFLQTTCRTVNSVKVSRHEVARTITLLMTDQGAQCRPNLSSEVRARANALRRSALLSLQDGGGSSSLAWQRLIHVHMSQAINYKP